MDREKDRLGVGMCDLVSGSVGVCESVTEKDDDPVGDALFVAVVASDTLFVSTCVGVTVRCSLHESVLLWNGVKESVGFRGVVSCFVTVVEMVSEYDSVAFSVTVRDAVCRVMVIVSDTVCSNVIVVDAKFVLVSVFDPVDAWDVVCDFSLLSVSRVTVGDLVSLGSSDNVTVVDADTVSVALMSSL